MRVSWMVIAAVFIGGARIYAAAPEQDRVRTEIPYRDGTVLLVSDFQERITKTRYRARGQAEITFQDVHITAEDLEYDEVTREGLTRGTTRFSQKQQWLTCSRAEFNFSSQTGTFYDASGFTDQEFLVRGRTVEQKQALYRRIADNLSAAGVRAEDVFVQLTETGREDWSFGSGEAQALDTELLARYGWTPPAG